MYVLILSEYDLIKNVTKNVVKIVIPNCEVLAISPRVVKSFNNQSGDNYFYSDFYWNFASPDIILIDLDSSNDNDSTLKSAVDIIKGEIFGQKTKGPTVAFMSTSLRQREFSEKLKRNDTDHDQQRYRFLHINKPFTLRALSRFVADIYSISANTSYCIGYQ